MAPTLAHAPPKALFFDVFGTVVDWRTTVTDHLSRKAHDTLNAARPSHTSSLRLAASRVDWAHFAQEWRNSYLTFTRTHDPTSPFKNIDAHHHDSLIALIKQHGIEGLWSDEEVRETSRIWHFLTPWPDSARGISLLNAQGFTTATLSNGNTSLLADMATHASLPWTRIVSAEQFGAYKPHPSVYRGACAALGLPPSECALVAAHLGDLEAAAGCGLRTIYVERTGEEAWEAGRVSEARQAGWVDMWVGGKEDLAGGGFLEIARRFEGVRVTSQDHT